MNPDVIFETFYNQAMSWINTSAQAVNELPRPYAVAAGMLATVNPCGFVMLPAYAAFYSTADGSLVVRRRQVARATWMGILVTVAFVGIFALAGLVITIGGRALMEWAGWAGAVVGVLLVLLGGYQLLARRSVVAGWTPGIRVERKRTTGGVLLFGVGYATCSLGCTLPAFLVVAGSVFLGDRDFASSLVRFVEFGLGMGVVFTMASVMVTLARNQVMRFARPIMPVTEVAANVLLILAGLYVVWYWTSKGQVII
jgi:cytochrome c biogenesis protein CcdA